MYRPRHFDVSDRATLLEQIRKEPFGVLFSQVDQRLVASHVPFLLETGDGGDVLFGHVARPNEQWRDFDGRREVLVVFSGPHAYVSPAWASPEKTVPTWNYVAVHVYGVPRIVEDPTSVRRRIDELVAEHEGRRDRPWASEQLPDELVGGLLRGIVAFELVVDRIEGKWKLSQNKSEDDRRGVVQGLEAEGGAPGWDVAREMRKELP